MNHPGDILAEAREAIRAAAERVRAMPDIDLVRLAMGNGAALPERACRECGCTDDDCSRCVEKTGEACHWVEADLCSACVPKPKAKPRPTRPRRPSVVRPASDVGLEGRQLEIYEVIKKHGPMRCGQIAKRLGVSVGIVSGSIYVIVGKGLLEKDPGQFGAYHLAGTRQTGAKKTRKPPKGADEEEGPPVKLSLVRPAAPVPAPRIADRVPLAPVRKPAFVATLELEDDVDRRGDSGIFRLPVLVAGPGDRNCECALYDGCLDRFFKGPGRNSRTAHCPPKCPSFTEVPAHVRFGLAMSGAVSALAHAAETPRRKNHA